MLPLWLMSSFEALWGDFGNDSHSPLQEIDAERLTSQVWLKPGQHSFLAGGHV